MKVGEIWEFHNGSTGEVRSYRLEYFETEVMGPRARLARLDDDGEVMVDDHGKPSRIAQVQVGTLFRGPERPSATGSHWKRVSEAPVPEFEQAGAAA